MCILSALKRLVSAANTNDKKCWNKKYKANLEQNYFLTTNNGANIEKFDLKIALQNKQKKITKIITDFLRKYFDVIYP